MLGHRDFLLQWLVLLLLLLLLVVVVLLLLVLLLVLPLLLHAESAGLLEETNWPCRRMAAVPDTDTKVVRSAEWQKGG